ncbi:uncharacterized protein [Clytia hemisphaerica]|uniref:uncharacterized protein n=1 Tax=Clytia hemisphaerica TaxID=252671 RepID=UPI0034D4BDE9
MIKLQNNLGFEFEWRVRAADGKMKKYGEILPATTCVISTQTDLADLELDVEQQLVAFVGLPPHHSPVKRVPPEIPATSQKPARPQKSTPLQQLVTRDNTTTLTRPVAAGKPNVSLKLPRDGQVENELLSWKPQIRQNHCP